MSPWFVIGLLWVAVVVALLTHVYEQHHESDPWTPWDDLLKQERGQR